VNAAAEFFQGLNAQGYEPLLARVQGNVRFDLRHGGRIDRWLVRIDRGNVYAARDRAAADCVVAADRSTFERIVGGRANAMAALLRGALVVEGRMELLVELQRIFPGPPGGRVPDPGGSAA
jgi:putative sterol carrier protein